MLEESFGFVFMLAVGLMSIWFCLFGLQWILFGSMISTGVLLRSGVGAEFQFIIVRGCQGVVLCCAQI